MEDTYRLKKEIKAEFSRKALNTYQNITNIKISNNTLIFFIADDKFFSARLTSKTGRLKRNSIRISY